ncbi:MAG: hypothetical protein ACI4IG_04390 [Eubacterium sp.]
MKKLNINKKYDDLIDYSVYDYSDFYYGEYLDCFFWFDKKRYKFIDNEDFAGKKNIDTERYVKFIWFDDCDMIDFYVNQFKNEKVREYLTKPDDERLSIRVRIFIDWNDLDPDFMMYSEYLVFTDKVVKWCEENGINYEFERKAPPKNYEKIKQNYENYEWVIPTD